MIKSFLNKKLTFTKPDKLIYKYLWCIPFWRAVLEAWGLGFVILFLLSQIVGDVSPFVLTNGILFLCGACGMCFVLRANIPESLWWQQIVGEIGRGFVVSMFMLVGLLLPAIWLEWDAIWLQSTLTNTGGTSLLMAMTGPGYVCARIGVRIWLVWQQARRRRMLWTLTHAHLTLVFIITVLAIGGMLTTSLASILYTSDMTVDNIRVAVIENLLHSVFPAFAISLVFLGFTLVVVLPPSLLVSFFISRKITRRLESLAKASHNLQAGEYASRIEVSGEDEVAQLQATFNTMAANLEQTLDDLQTERDRVTALLQSRRELVASVSHELRTPVATVRGYLDSVQRYAVTLPEDTQRDLDVMGRELTHLQHLIDDLFTLSQTEAGGLSLNLGAVDVVELVRRRVQAFAPLAWQRERVDIVADIAPNIPHVHADAHRLDQVLINLLRNALRHTPPGGIVAVIVNADAEAARNAGVTIEVRDTGEGIPADELPHIWERFYRGENAQAQQTRANEERGAGLGLALVKELVEAMGGSVTVESEVGQGSCFVVVLPCASLPANHSANS